MATIGRLHRKAGWEDGVKVVPAQAQQTQIGLEHIAGGDACPNGKGGIEQGFELGRLQLLGQSGPNRREN